MKEKPFSSVSYKHDITLTDILWCENWIEKRLKPLSKSNGQNNKKHRKQLYEQRSNVEYTHFIKAYKDHKREVERMKKRL